MIIEVQVKPGSKKETVEIIGPDRYKIFLKQRAVEGRANEALREVLADYFGTARSKVHILHGLKGRIKRVEILEK